MLTISPAYFLTKGCLVNKKKKGVSFSINNEIQQTLENVAKGYPTSLNKELLAYLLQKGILLENNDRAYDPICQSGPLSKWRLFIQITNQCNLFCRHCFVDSKKGNKQFFSYTSLMKLIYKAIALGITNISFTGGEVFTQDYFFDVLSELEYTPVSYTLFTNLTTLNEDELIFVSALKGLDSVITSIDYYDECKHDHFRGMNGAHRLAIHNILELKRLGVNVCVNTMVMDDNHDDIWDLARLFSKEGISIRFDTIINSGRGRSMKPQQQGYEKNISFIHEVIQWLASEGWCVDSKKGTCGIGESLLYMHHDGNFMVCPGLTDQYGARYNLGQDILIAMQRLKSLDLSCNNASCIKRKECTQGCRMRALEETGCVNGPDLAVCFYESLA